VNIFEIISLADALQYLTKSLHKLNASSKFTGEIESSINMRNLPVFQGVYRIVLGTMSFNIYITKHKRTS
jgi:hypothetical protein